jgi:hypothetical protein
MDDSPAEADGENGFETKIHVQVATLEGTSGERDGETKTLP